MRAAVISLGSKSSLWTVDAMKKYFDIVDSINLKEIDICVGEKDVILYQGKPLPKYDCIYAKGSFRYAPILRAITQELGTDTYFPISPEAFTVVHDKFLTHLLLQKEKIPMPKTYLASGVEASRALLEKIHYPIILKLLQGTQGKGVMFADSHAAASSILDTLASLSQPFIIQEFIETGGTDTRVIVCGDEVIGTMVRKAKENEQRSNIHSGGTGHVIEASPEVKRIAIKAAKLLGTDIGGVDILDGPKGPVVIEANLSPGLQGITEATGDDIAGRIAKYLFEKTVEYKQNKEGVSAESVFDEVGIDLAEKIKTEGPQDIITNLDIRGNKVVLPEIVNKIAKFKEDEEYIISAEPGKVNIRKGSM